jgi:hypothetical protein
LTGTGEVVSIPDIASFNFSVNEVSESVDSAQKIATDLIAGDFCKKKVDFLQLNIKELEKKVVLKDSIIFNRESKITNLNSIILKKDEMFTIQEEISKTYLKDLRKSKRTTLLYKIFAIIGATSTGYFILSK